LGVLKTNTVLQYDEHYMNVESWGYPALSKRPNKKKRTKNESRPVELFKLHLGNLSDNLKPELPVDYKKAITDYLQKIGELIREIIEIHWSGIDLEKVLFVVTVPAEYLEKDKAIMRECVYNAGLIKERESKNLQFTTERK
jgi:hypothetical protein